MMRNLKYLLPFLLLCFAAKGHSQNVLQSTDQDLEASAKQTAEMWAGELAMSPKQMELMEEKLVEYAIKKQSVLQSKMREEAKTEALLDLQLAENKSMRDILTKPQYDLYISLLNEKIKSDRRAEKKAPPSEKE